MKIVTKYGRFISLIFVLIIGFVFGSSNLLQNPPVWPDEAIYADIARNILTTNQVSSTLLQGLIPGFELHADIYPPVFFYILSFWFRLFGFSIINQRLLSLVAGLLLVMVFSLLMRLINKKSKYEYLSTFILISLLLDNTFLKGIRLSRPEIFVLLFGCLSAYLALLNNRLSKMLFLICGLLSGFAFLAHTNGVIFVLAISIYQIIKYKSLYFKSGVYLFMIGFMSVVAYWAISSYSHLYLYVEHFRLSALRKTVEEMYYQAVFKYEPLRIQIAYILYAVVSVMFIGWSIYKKNNQCLLLAILLLFTWIIALLGKLTWYYIYPLPFIYIGLFILIVNYVKRKPVLLLLLSTFVLLIVCNVQSLFVNLSVFTKNDFSYPKYTDEISKLIPQHASVFLSAIPDPYFGLITHANINELQLREFPPLPTNLEKYAQVLDTCDYIVYNGSYEFMLHGNFLYNYIQRNLESVTLVGDDSSYKVLVVKLKPRATRI